MTREARGYRAPLLRLHAEVLTRQEPGDHARALESLNEALALATEAGMRPDAAHCHLDLGRLHRRTGEPEQAQRHLTTAAVMYREMRMHYWLDKAETEMETV
jgi:tetratricopeptide (TPR) repeat protein